MRKRRRRWPFRVWSAALGFCSLPWCVGVSARAIEERRGEETDKGGDVRSLEDKRMSKTRLRSVFRVWGAALGFRSLP
jgi:hypothetical protein